MFQQGGRGVGIQRAGGTYDWAQAAHNANTVPPWAGLEEDAKSLQIILLLVQLMRGVADCYSLCVTPSRLETSWAEI